jgi:hypothetical protein
MAQMTDAEHEYFDEASRRLALGVGIALGGALVGAGFPVVVTIGLGLTAGILSFCWGAYKWVRSENQ